MNLLRFRNRTKDLHLPNGRVVKVEVSDDGRRQHVHDHLGRVHATARPDPIRLTFHMPKPGVRGTLGRLRADRRATNGPSRWRRDDNMGLWAPLPDDVCDRRDQLVVSR